MRRVTVVVSVVAATLGLAACTPTLTVTTEPAPAHSIARVSVQPDPATPLGAPVPLTVGVTDGVFTEVSLVGPAGAIPGALSQDGTTWTAAEQPFTYGARYALEATAVDYQGQQVTTRNEWTTVDPERFFTASADPAEGAVVGVGMPIVVRFSADVVNRADVESALRVTTPTRLLGAWSWRDERTVEFRPRELWPGNITVTLDMDLAGVQAKPGVYGAADTTQTFFFRPSMVSVVDAASHMMQVFQDGTLVKTIPVTTGKPGFETRSGTKVLLTKERVRIMDAASGGTDPSSPEYYRVEAPYAMRLTHSGEFVHAAPWSVDAQGFANVSHGCVGMSVTNGQWWWNNNEIGDVVVVRNTPRTQGDDGNGLTIWNATWDEWLDRSATGAHFTEAYDAPSAGVATPDTL